MRPQNQRKNLIEDEKFMRLAIAEAARGVGFTSPNPAVGAVIVRGGRVISRGYHCAAGCPHAEVEALRGTSEARGATLYVTLEPCSTHGRTPPCTEAIGDAGLARVVVGAIDPNPSHAGLGLEILSARGVSTRQGVLEEECRELNVAFNHWIVSGLPWVIAKAALTLDGRLTLPPGSSRWLSGPVARAHVHRQRARVDAVLIGAGTLRADNPRLTVRGVEGARQPWRVLLAGETPLRQDAHLFTDPHRDRTLVYEGETLPAVLRDLGKRQVTSVLIEGGGKVLGSALAGGLVDEVQFYLTPHLAGGRPGIDGPGVRFPALERVRFERLGSDVLLCGRTVETKRRSGYDSTI